MSNLTIRRTFSPLHEPTVFRRYVVQFLEVYFMNEHDDFLNEVIESRDSVLSIPKSIKSDVIDCVTTKELAQLLMDFSFSGGILELDDDSNVFSVDIGYSNALFFSNSDWNANTPVNFFGVITTVQSSFNKQFITLFNQNTKIGRLYNADEESGCAVYRLDVHLEGGITHRNIFYLIKNFIDTYNKLFYEVAEGISEDA